MSEMMHGIFYIHMRSLDTISCHAISCHTYTCHTISCHTYTCHTYTCHTISCHTISCHALPHRMQLDTVRVEARNPERTKGGGMNSISLATGAPLAEDVGDG